MLLVLRCGHRSSRTNLLTECLRAVGGVTALLSARTKVCVRTYESSISRHLKCGEAFGYSIVALMLSFVSRGYSIYPHSQSVHSHEYSISRTSTYTRLYAILIAPASPFVLPVATLFELARSLPPAFSSLS